MAGASVTLSASDVTGNTAPLGGGVAMADGATLVGGRIGHNLGVTAAGGVYATGTVVLDGVDVVGNAAEYGGGVGVLDAAVELRGCTVAGNVATFGGGLSAARGSVVLGDTVLRHNVAVGRGGGVYALGATVVGGVLDGNHARFGGGGFVRDGVLADCTVTGNTAEDSGGIDASATSSGSAPDVLVSGCDVRDNHASIDGGGLTLFRADGRPAVVADTVLAGNHAGDAGGGLFVNETEVVLERCTVEGNDAGATGGAMWLDGGDASVVDSTVRGNSAPAGGGATVGADPYGIAPFLGSSGSDWGAGARDNAPFDVVYGDVGYAFGAADFACTPATGCE
jgi:hypothetical protein